MEITTKFDIGDKVYRVWSRTRRIIEKCSVCGGAGKVRVVGSSDLIRCPKCYEKGETESGEVYVEHVVSSGPLTVGLVGLRIEGPIYGGGPRDRGYDVDQSNMGPRSYKREETYMMEETGVGSGTVYRVDDLFATREEAEAEARRRTEASIESIVEYDDVETTV